jgi:hypothetical protein
MVNLHEFPFHYFIPRLFGIMVFSILACIGMYLVRNRLKKDKTDEV